MRKTPFLLTLLASALLTACGGGGGGSSSGDTAGTNDQNQGGQNSGDQGSGEQGSENQGSETPEAAVLTFDARFVDYAAVKIAGGEWKKIPAEKHSVTSTNPGGDLEVLIASVCRNQYFSSISYDLQVEAVNLNRNKEWDIDSGCDSNIKSSGLGSVTATDDILVSGIVGLTDESNGDIRIFFEGNQHTADLGLIFTSGNERRIYTQGDVILNDGASLTFGSGVLLSETAATNFNGIEYHVRDTETLDINSVMVPAQTSLAYVIPASSRLTNDFYALYDDENDGYSYRANVEDFQSVQPTDFSSKKIYEDQLVIENNRLTFTVSNISDLKPEGLDVVSLASENDLSGLNFAGYYIDGDLLKEGTYSIDIIDFATLPEFPFDTGITVAEIVAELPKNEWSLSFDNGVAHTKRGYKRLRLRAQER